MTKQHFNAIANVLREQMGKARYTDQILTPALTGATIDQVGQSSEVFVSTALRNISQTSSR